MNNLKPLVWRKNEDSIWSKNGMELQQATGAGITYTITDFNGYFTVTMSNLVKADKGLPRSSDNKSFKSYEEAVAFCEHEHYPHFMSEFVLPSPTWIDAGKNLPEDKEKYLVLTECSKVWTGHYGLVAAKPNEWWLHGYTVKQGWHPYTVTHWMPIPEFSKQGE